MTLDQVRKLFPDFENASAGLVADRIQLLSDVNWQDTIAANIYCIVDGSDSQLEEQAVMVEAFYDSTAWVPGSSPGADEACGIASLLLLARYLKENPPRADRHFSGHQRPRTIAGGDAGNGVELYDPIEYPAPNGTGFKKADQ